MNPKYGAENPVLEILEQYKQLKRRHLNAAKGSRQVLEFKGLVRILSIALILVGLCFLAYLPLKKFYSVVGVAGVTFLSGGLLLFLGSKLVQKRSYNKWRMSFADEQMSTDNQNHWFPQFSRYIPFSWWKKLLQGPWNSLKRRKDTAAADIPLEPTQSNVDEPPGPST